MSYPKFEGIFLGYQSIKQSACCFVRQCQRWRFREFGILDVAICVCKKTQNQTTKIRTRNPSRSLGKLKESLDNLSTQPLSLAALSPSTLVVGKTSASMACAWTKVSCLWLYTPTFLPPLPHQDILMCIPLDPSTQLIFIDRHPQGIGQMCLEPEQGFVFDRPWWVGSGDGYRMWTLIDREEKTKAGCGKLMCSCSSESLPASKNLEFAHK